MYNPVNNHFYYFFTDIHRRTHNSDERFMKSSTSSSSSDDEIQLLPIARRRREALAVALSRDRDPAYTASPVPSSSCLRDNDIQSLHDGRASDASDGPARMNDEHTHHRRPSKR